VTDANPPAPVYRFGVYELDAGLGELRKDGNPQPRLRDQALRILLMLLERPRDLVTRDELRDRLWSADTFVDFDHGLNTAINQLRNALGDSAASPRFIQTVPRRGYRFIAPVEVKAREDGATKSSARDSATAAAAALWREDAGASAEPPQGGTSLLSEAAELPAVSGGVVRVLFALVQVMYLSFYVISLARLSRVDAILAESRIAPAVALVVLIVTAACGIPTRLYLLSAAAFNYRGLGVKFQKLFPFLLPFDELWALAPFLLVHQIGVGLAIGATAALLYVPFAQRSLVLMGYAPRPTQPS
jgi:cholera toxin transcriptional activator